MKKRVALLIVLCLTMGGFAGCGNSAAISGKTDGKEAVESTGAEEEDLEAEYEPVKLKIATISGHCPFVPAYMAEEKGWFKEKGLEIEVISFSGGPAMMESLASDSWDIGYTGAGGVFSGLNGQDIYVINTTAIDNGTHKLYARPDSAIVAAGQGNNAVNDEIYGDAESWKGVQVLCPSGSTLQYLLGNVLKGFNLDLSDVDFMAMDMASANAAFLSGSGEVVAVWGSVALDEDKEQFVEVAHGPGVTNIVANQVVNAKSYDDPAKYDAIKRYLGVYFDAIDYIQENPEEGYKYYVECYEDDGFTCDEEAAKRQMEVDTYYDLEDSYALLNNQAEGQDCSELEAILLDNLDFFISCGNYTEDLKEKITDKYISNKVINEIYEERH